MVAGAYRRVDCELLLQSPCPFFIETFDIARQRYLFVELG